MRVLLLFSVFSLALAPAAQRDVRFETQQIRDDFGVGYAVTVADVNGDKKPDVLAISGTQLVWFENPSWQAHVVLDGQTPKDNVTLAPHDIDRDGRLDVALGATWNPSDTNGGGTLHWAVAGRRGRELDAARHHHRADAASHPLGERRRRRRSRADRRAAARPRHGAARVERRRSAAARPARAQGSRQGSLAGRAHRRLRCTSCTTSPCSTSTATATTS